MMHPGLAKATTRPVDAPGSRSCELGSVAGAGRRSVIRFAHVTRPPGVPANSPLMYKHIRAGCLALLLATPAVAQEPRPATPEVFRRHGDQVVKIRVIESGSAAKASIGSGFYVTAGGRLVTNYHVISSVVHHPNRYRAEVVDQRGRVDTARVLAIDVVHDLAILSTTSAPARFLSLEGHAEQGDRLYSLGHPHDLGLSIVEGTFNGLLQHTLYPKIHFTGSINPGMSGGPTIADNGRVVGINVSTASNQVSFLVPVARARELLARADDADAETAPKMLDEVARQLREYQSHYLRDMFSESTPTVTLGQFRLPTEPAPFFKCWADATRRPEQPYERVHHYCSTDDYVFISGEHSSGTVELEHQLLTSKKLSAPRFFALYTSNFSGDSYLSGSEEEVTRFKCDTRNIRNEGITMRAAVCLRRYRKLDGLYDAVVKTAVLGRRGEGLLSTLTLSGITYESAQQVTRRYLESIAWRDR